MDYIVILERTAVTPLTIRYLLRADVPVARQTYFADATKASAYPSISVGDLADLRAGKVLETVSEFGVGGFTVAQVKTALEGLQAAFQARVTADAEFNPWKWYGSSYNGTTWTNGGVS